MTKPNQKSSPRVVIEYTDWTRFLPWLTQAAFLLAIGLVAARAMMLESTRETFDSMNAATQAPRTCGPAGSVVLDLFCCVPMLLVLLRRSLDKSYIIRFSWGAALFGMLALWALLSTCWAGDRFQAMAQAFHLIAAASIFWAMAQLVRSWTRLRIVAGICMGLLLVYVAHGLFYQFSDLADVKQFWQEHRAEEMRAHDWKEGDFALKQYEQKILGGEMIGFDASPNSFAAAIVLLAIVVAGVGVQRIINKDESGLVGAAFLPLPLALWIIYYTQSKAAFGTLIIAVAVLATFALFAPALGRNRNRAFWLSFGALAFVALAVIGHGRFHGSLPTDSLNFRWRYWTASLHMVGEHPLRGVGYGNFGNSYLAVRLPVAAEEIKDPHNIFVRIISELGIVGAILLMLWLLRSWWEWTRPTLPAAAPPESSKIKTSQRNMMATLSTLAILSIAIKIFAGTDLFTGSAGWLTFELLKDLAYAALLLIGAAIVVVDSSKGMLPDGRPAPWVLYAMLAAVGVFLIHNMVDFAFFENGPMMLCMLIGGAALGIRAPSAIGKRKQTGIAIGTFAAVTLAWLVAGIFIALPFAEAANSANAGDEAFRKGDAKLAAENYEAAFATAPVKNSDYASRAARALMYIRNEDGMARAYLGHAIAASPVDPFPYLSRARYNLEHHPDDSLAIHADYERALALNPNDVDAHLEYAAALEKLGDARAAEPQYRAALQIDAAFDAAEPKRLPTTRVSEIEQKLSSLK